MKEKMTLAEYAQSVDMTGSYPFWRFHRVTGLDYGDILLHADAVRKNALLTDRISQHLQGGPPLQENMYVLNVWELGAVSRIGRALGEAHAEYVRCVVEGMRANGVLPKSSTI